MKDEAVFSNALAAVTVALIVLLAGCDSTEPCRCHVVKLAGPDTLYLAW